MWLHNYSKAQLRALLFENKKLFCAFHSKPYYSLHCPKTTCYKFGNECSLFVVKLKTL